MNKKFVYSGGLCYNYLRNLFLSNGDAVPYPG